MSFKSEQLPHWIMVSRKPLPAGENHPEFTNFVSFGLAWPPYVIWQSREPDGYRRFRFGWRYDFNWRGYIFPSAARKKSQAAPLHRGY